MSPKIAIAIPCYNEEATIASVIRDFKKAVPEAAIHVFNNCSSDKSVALARAEGVAIHDVRRLGKGNVLRAIFDTVVADAVIVVDGDGTYSADEARQLLRPVLEAQADMVVGDRLTRADQTSLIHLRRIGNRLIVAAINFIFGTAYRDILSGYRVLSRRFIESVPLLTPGFETETEMTLQALEEGFEVVEIPVSYTSRPERSESKLRPFRDGWRIMMTVAMILRDHHPLRLYGFVGAASFGAALLTVFVKWVAGTHEPVLSGLTAALIFIGLIALGMGLVLSAINTRLKEIKQIMRRHRPGHGHG